MAKLGDSFPSELKDDSIESLLLPGQIIKLEVEFVRTRKTKDKLLVLSVSEETSYLFCINSEIPKFIQARKYLRKCQIEIKQAQYDFLDHNSYINCSEIIKIDLTDIKNQIKNDVSRIKERLNNKDIKQLIKVVDKADTLSKLEKEIIIKSLT